MMMMKVTQMNEVRASHTLACLLACLLAVPAATAAELRPRLVVLPILAVTLICSPASSVVPLLPLRVSDNEYDRDVFRLSV